jgi:hypothetical protein
MSQHINQQIEVNENNARQLKQWLNDNPSADEQEIADKKKELLQALQNINDLVCSLRPFKLYTLR